MHTIHFLKYLVAHHQLLIYVVLYLGLLIEGEFFLISTGVLIHLGALPVLPVIFIVFSGCFSKTFLGYFLGEALSRNFKSHWLFRFIQKRVYQILPQWKEKPFWSIFFSKFIMGANNLTIIFSGYERISFSEFLRAEFLSTITWAPALLSLGFFFSYTALLVSHEVWKFLLTILVLFVLFVVFDKIVSYIYELVEGLYYGND